MSGQTFLRTLYNRELFEPTEEVIGYSNIKNLTYNNDNCDVCACACDCDACDCGD